MYLSPQFIFTSLAVFYGIVALPAIVAPKKFKGMFTDFVSNSRDLRLLSFFILLFSFLLFSINWKITMTAEGLIALLAWITLAKSITNLYFPKFTSKIAKYFLKSTMSIVFIGVIALAFAVLFGYFAYTL